MAFGSKFSNASGTGNSNPNNWMIPHNSGGGGGAGGGGSSGKGSTTTAFNPPPLVGPPDDYEAHAAPSTVNPTPAAKENKTPPTPTQGSDVENGIYGSVLTPGENSTSPVYTPVLNKDLPIYGDGGLGTLPSVNHSEPSIGETGTECTETGGETSTMTYEQYIAEQKALEEEKRQAALKEAEVYKERAATDAQASYMQNMSTYGVNAENMAKMGLTGGGYSDYLNAQAYAQKRDDMQAADRNKLAMEQQAESTYADNIAALDKEYFAYQETEKQNKKAAYNSLLTYAMNADSGLTEETIRAMGTQAGLSEEEIQSVINTMNTAKTNADNKENEKYAKSVYNTLWEAVQDPDSNYTEEGIRAMGAKAGLSEEDINMLVNMHNATMTKKAEEAQKAEDEKAQEEQETFNTNSANVTSTTISYIIANGGGQAEYIESIKGTLTESDYNKLVTQNQKSTYEYYEVALNSGSNINTNEVETMYKKGNLSEPQYEAIKALWNTQKVATDNTAFMDSGKNTISYTDAKTLFNEVQASTWVSDQNKKAIEKTYMRLYAKDIANEVMVASSAKGTPVDIYASDFKTTKFGDYTDMGESGTKQEDYAQAIVSAAKAGDIQVGQYVIMNYGNTWDSDCVFVYIGDGLFVPCEDGNGDAKTFLSGDGFKSDISFYCPSGYEFTFSNGIAFHVDKE